MSITRGVYHHVAHYEVKFEVGDELDDQIVNEYLLVRLSRTIFITLK